MKTATYQCAPDGTPASASDAAVARLEQLRPDLPPHELARALEDLAAPAAASARGIDSLVSLLSAHESAHGVTDAHHVASEKVRERLTLVHPFAHDAEISAVALSRSGRWLATGNAFVPSSDDYEEGYERGGVVSIWDVRLGRCVNVLGRIHGGVGSGEEEARGLAWHESEARLGASTGTHGVACLDPFTDGTGIVSSITEGQLKGASFDGSSPSWCWLPGTNDIVIAKYIVTMGEKSERRAKKGAKTETAMVRTTLDDARCDFRHRVCAYDGVVTDGHFTVRADTLAPTDTRPFRDARMGSALADLEVRDGVVSFTSPSGRITLDVKAKRVGIEKGFVPVSTSPDGREVAVLTAEGRVERFSNEGAPLPGFDAPWAEGIVLGASNVLVLLAPDRLAFVDLATSRTLGDFTELRELAPHPLGTDEATRKQAFVYDPAFALGDGWAVALPTGEVAAPEAAHALLDSALSFSLGRRRAWPLRWTESSSAAVRLSTSVADLATKLPTKIRANLKPAAGKQPGKPGKRAAPTFEIVPATTADVLDYAGARLEAALPSMGGHLIMHECELLAVAEAAAGAARADRAVALFERALAITPEEGGVLRGGVARSAAFGAGLLARVGAGAKSHVARLASAVLALPEHEFAGSPEGQAATRAQLARAYDRIGDALLAGELLEQALALAPSWLREPVPYAPLLGNSDEAALVAKMLLALGQRDQKEKAFRIFANLGGGSGVTSVFLAAAEAGDRDTVLRLSATYRNVTHDHERAAALLLEKGHFTLFDELIPGVLESPYVAVTRKRELALARHAAYAISARTKEAEGTLAAEATGLLSTLDAKTPVFEVVARLLAVGSALDVCREAGLAEVMGKLADALSTALAGAPAECFAGEPPVWKAARALERAGVDIAGLLGRATTPLARLLAVTTVLPSASGNRATVIALAKSIDPSSAPANRATLLSEAAVVLSNAGEATLAESFFAGAVVAAASNDLTLGNIAADQMRVLDFVGAWATVQRAPKSKRDRAIATFLASAAWAGHAPAVLAAARLTNVADRQSVIMAARSLAQVPFDAS